jgi:hypothetical protein
MTTWKKSSYSSDSGNCVEVRHVDGRVEIRDSKLSDDSPVITYSPDEWRAVLYAVNDGYEPGESLWCTDGSFYMRKDNPGPELHFTQDEWIAFGEGVSMGEFDGPVPVPA